MSKSKQNMGKIPTIVAIGALLLSLSASAGSLSVGSTEIPLGDAAFATSATCLTSEGCGGRNLTQLRASKFSVFVDVIDAHGRPCYRRSFGRRGCGS